MWKSVMAESVFFMKKLTRFNALKRTTGKDYIPDYGSWQQDIKATAKFPLHSLQFSLNVNELRKL